MTNEQSGKNCRWENNDSPMGVVCKEVGDANSELPPFGMESKEEWPSCSSNNRVGGI